MPLRRVAAIAALVIVALGGVRMRSSIAESFIFQPSRGADLSPERLGLEAEEIFLETEDGVSIHAYDLPWPDATRALLFLHGNAGSASHRLPNAGALARLGIHVLLLDYRGYGRSEGRASEQGVYADARAGLRHLIEARGFATERIVIFGRSLGGAVAIDIAAGRPLAGLILESTFTSIADVGRHLMGPPGAWLMGGRFRSVEKIRDVTSPLLFFHGEGDDLVPIDLGRRLFEAATAPKEFEVIAGAGHNDTIHRGGQPYFARIRRFLDRVAPETGAPQPAGNPALVD